MSKVEVYFARERALGATDRTVWEYVVEANDGKTSPVGYCAGWMERTHEEFLAEFGWYDGESLHVEQEARRPWKQKYHTDGHSSQDLAILCYREYRVDQELTLIQIAPGGPDVCAVCKAPAEVMTDFIGGGDARIYLCAAHGSKEMVKLLLPMDASPRRVIFY